MKTLINILLVFSITFSFVGCYTSSNKANNEDIHSEEPVVSPKEESFKGEAASEPKFTEQEIEQAISVAKVKFEDFKGCKLIKMVYDEDKSNAMTELYMQGGKGSYNGVKIENVIVLLSDFKVDATGADGSLNPNSTYTNWRWVLIRNGSSSEWVVDDWGY